MSGFLIKFRALKPEQKPLSIGIESLTKSLLAMVGSSMAYGALIDTSCRIWKVKKTGMKGIVAKMVRKIRQPF